MKRNEMSKRGVGVYPAPTADATGHWGPGRRESGTRLVAICRMIDQTIGHGDTASDLRNLLVVCKKLGYDEAQIETLLQEASAAYETDRGRSLIEQAFAE